ncbi:hypothetical protein B0T16DRAFT_489235 [Cercophora newfieldiana]|uniref:Uncharacterized protein n=1 Tax=Cercophora newfieldiana TaxID=92897 RepID=A0AA39YEH5_9PEZI|nr:hypothetical protein B0T16DRAFT_489235 [Cercophora newfieldiana]
MEDSPLSITASVAGILTFLAALIAFIYVRYQILQNGHDEIMSTLEATALSIDETSSMQAALLQHDQRHEAARRLRQCLQDLCSIDIDISGQCVMAAFGHNRTNEVSATGGLGEEHDADAPTTISETTPKAKGGRFAALAEKLRYFRNILRVSVQHAPGIWRSVHLVLNLIVGITPMLLRWYSVRKEVMKKVQQRNMLRSRILHQQMLLLHMELRELKSVMSVTRSVPDLPLGGQVALDSLGCEQSKEHVDMLPTRATRRR